MELISEMLNSFVRKAAKISMHYFSKLFGKGSRSHDLFGAACLKVIQYLFHSLRFLGLERAVLRNGDERRRT